ncbi:hypothetical protein D9M70_585850 [compost metagenome]
MSDGCACEADDRRRRHRRHQVGAEVLGHGTVGFIDEHVDVVAQATVSLDGLELVDHRDDQAPEVGVQQSLQFGLVVGPLNRDVLLLHLA